MQPSTENLKRTIGPFALALAIFNAVVGSGIFVLPALVVEGIGATAVLAYFICGAVILLIALCFAELGSRTDRSGGIYTYVEEAFGPFAGFLAASLYWIGNCIMADAAVANVLAGILAIIFPVLGQPGYRFLVILLVFGTVMLLNIRSARGGMGLVRITALSKIGPLLLLVIIASAFIDPSNLRWEVAPTWSNMGTASILLFYMFMGMEAPLSNGGEMKDPRRTVPLGLLLGMCFILMLYVSVHLVTQGVLGNTMPLHKDAPLAAVATIVAGTAGAVIILITGALSALGVVAVDMFSITRILFASARAGLMPGQLARVHPKFETPWISIIVYGSLGFVVAVSGSFRQLAIISSASGLLVYFGVMMAALQGKLQKRGSREGGFRIPFGPVIPALAGLVILWMLSHLEKKELLGMSGFITALSVIYFFMSYRKRKARIRPVGEPL